MAEPWYENPVELKISYMPKAPGQPGEFVFEVVGWKSLSVFDTNLQHGAETIAEIIEDAARDARATQRIKIISPEKSLG